MQKFLMASAATCALMVAGAANGADLIRKAPIVDTWSWSGFYGGVHFGSAWGQKEWTQDIQVDPVVRTIRTFNNLNNSEAPAFVGAPLLQDPFDTNGSIFSNSSHSVNGFLGGLQVGWNFQNDRTVWGLEAQFSWSDIKGKGACGLVAIFNCSDKVDWLGTAAVRVGYTVDHALIFIKGGAAWAHDQYNLNILGISSPINTFTSLSDTRWGWMWGTGVEYMFRRNWSAKLEYDYMDLGTKTYAFPNPTGIAQLERFYDRWDINQRIHLIKFGVNYHFDWYTPVVAKY